jgi:hypothetical protein
MSHFTHTFELVASLWQFPRFPQINEKIQLFPTIWNRARCDKNEKRGISIQFLQQPERFGTYREEKLQA